MLGRFFEKPKPSPQEVPGGPFAPLINDLERILSVSSSGDDFMKNFVRRLGKERDKENIKIFIVNESDKFRSYGDIVLDLIIDSIYGGSGSPWMSHEKKRAGRIVKSDQESSTGVDDQQVNDINPSDQKPS